MVQGPFEGRKSVLTVGRRKSGRAATMSTGHSLVSNRCSGRWPRCCAHRAGRSGSGLRCSWVIATVIGYDGQGRLIVHNSSFDNTCHVPVENATVTDEPEYDPPSDW